MVEERSRAVPENRQGGFELASMMEAAGQAHSSGDFATAESLLRDVVRSQQAGLGPLHPDLANTLNNLAVVCESANKLEDAERCYRRAYAITSALLDPQHPLVTTSRDNLRDFCDAHGLRLEELAAQDVEAVATLSVPTAPSAATSTAVGLDIAPTLRATPTAMQTAMQTAAPRAVPQVVPQATAAPRSQTTRRSSRVLVGGGLAAAALIVVLLAAWSARIARAPGVFPEVSPPAFVAPASDAITSDAAATTGGASTGDATTGGATGGVQVLEAALCQDLSTEGSRWNCVPPSNPTAPGLLYFYTRISAPRPVRVHHRWYQGDRLRQDVQLMVSGNPGAGYRTYSQKSVSANGGGDWRIELATADGVLLRAQNIVVR
jgi:hypothetical protein